MSERQYKWKQTANSGQRQNNTLIRDHTLPNKFRPSRQRSESVDRVFNNSRSRINSSNGDISGVSISRDDERLVRQKTPIKGISIKQERPVLIQSIIKVNSISQPFRHQFAGNDNNNVLRSTKMVTEIKKEFLLFKQNVLQQLQRQKQIVNRLLKQIILTIDYELQKMGRKVSLQEHSTITSLDSNKTDNCQFKTVQQWKHMLQKTNITADQSKITSKFSANSSNKPTISDKAQLLKEETKLSPPQIQTDITNFVRGLAKLKEQMSELDNVCKFQYGKDGIERIPI